MNKEKDKLKAALEEYRVAKKEYGWQAALTPEQLSNLRFWEQTSEILAGITGITVIVGILFLIFNYGIVNFLWICLKLVLYSPLIILAIPLHIIGVRRLIIGGENGRIQ